MTALFDFHCHLGLDRSATVSPAPDQASFRSPPAPPLAGRLLCGVSIADWEGVKALSESWAGTIPAFGLHPWHIHNAARDAAVAPADNDGGWPGTLERFLASTPGSWLGEAGLDHRRRGIASESEQLAAFAEQLRIAARLGRRVNLHCVGAWNEVVAALDAHYLSAMPGAGFIVHAFGGPYQGIGALAERGAYFTVGPLSARGNSRKMRERAALLPKERILLESDAFLSPGCDAAREIEETAVWLAAVRGLPVAELKEQIERNTQALLVDV